MTGDPATYSGCIGRCGHCGKYSYLSRAKAKRAVRRLADRMSAYRCRNGGDMWHIGHLPPVVIRGAVSRDQIVHVRRRQA